jgi:hypothetical protein
MLFLGHQICVAFHVVFMENRERQIKPGSIPTLPPNRHAETQGLIENSGPEFILIPPYGLCPLLKSIKRRIQ